MDLGNQNNKYLLTGNQHSENVNIILSGFHCHTNIMKICLFINCDTGLTRAIFTSVKLTVLVEY